MWKHRNLGFSLLEMSLALIVAALVLTYAIQERARSLQLEAATIQADQILQLQRSVATYIEQHRDDILNNEPILYESGLTDSLGQVGLLAGDVVGSLLRPTVDQLRLLGLLPSNFSTRASVVDGALQVQLDLVPEGCVGRACRIEGVVYVDKPIRAEEQGPDEYNGVIVGEILSRLGGYGFASIRQGTEVVAAGGNFVLPNPDPQGSAGMVGMLVGNQVNRADFEPIAGLDYCPAGIYYFPKPTGGGGGAPRLISLGEVASLKNTGCTISFNDIAKGYSTMGFDPDPPVTGWTRLSCEIGENGQLNLRDTGVVTGERSCNNNGGGGNNSTTTTLIDSTKDTTGILLQTLGGL